MDSKAPSLGKRAIGLTLIGLGSRNMNTHLPPASLEPHWYPSSPLHCPCADVSFTCLGRAFDTGCCVRFFNPVCVLGLESQPQ